MTVFLLSAASALGLGDRLRVVDGRSLRAVGQTRFSIPDFRSWTGLGWTEARFQQGPGQVDRLWILDLGSQRLVVDAF